MYEEKDYQEKEPKVEKKVKKEKKKILKLPKKKKNLEEKKEAKTQKVLGIKADWISILIRFVIFLIIAFLVIFIVTKITHKGNTFADNLEKMKEVASAYFDVSSHRPVSIQEEVLLTLEDLENANLIQELKDTHQQVCSKTYSYVSMTKIEEEKFRLNIYLSCGGEAKSAFYDYTYPSKKDDQIDNQKVVLYELKRNVASSISYECPSGYQTSGRYCVRNDVAKISATPIYKVIPSSNTKASYKASGFQYEYQNPIKNVVEPSYQCPSGYELVGTNCVRYGQVYYKNTTNYLCPNGGTPTGSRCYMTISSTYEDQLPYCKNGHEINGSCYVSTNYQLTCKVGKKDSSNHACYITYPASKELSEWMFESKVKYPKSREVKDGETVRYIEESEDGNYIIYRREVRTYEKVCDGDDRLINNVCRHYDEAYETKSCSSSRDTLSSDGKECYHYEEMSYRKVDGDYRCPNGYQPKGTGSSRICYKYEPAVKDTQKTPYCSSKYDLTSDGKCVQTIPATLSTNEIHYDCPEGYSSKGSGENTVCYKKTTSDSYYYCLNNKATLDETRCITPEETIFLGYRCPSGYDLNGSSCIKMDVNAILATKVNTPSQSEETIWSKTKDINGWTWTGNTKEA